MDIDSKSERYTLYTWSKQSGLNRKSITRAKEIYFWDKDGKRYLDFASQLVNVNLGHNNPKLIASIQKQATKLMYAAPSFASKPKADLAEKLVHITGLGKVFFTTGGSEANENAIIIARQYTGRDYILTRNPSYHGATYGSRTASNDSTRKFEAKYNSPYFDSFSAPYCYKVNDKGHQTCCEASLKELKSLIKKHRQNIAAVLLEPIPGGQGVLIPSDNYLYKLCQICRKNKIIVIFDEIMTGFGRTGKWFSYQHWGVKSDILTLSKGISGGAIPLGAVVVSKEIAGYFDENLLVAGLTNSGHPLACAAGLAAVNIYEDQDLIKRSSQLGKILKKMLNKLKDDHPMIGDVRSLGLFSAVEFTFDGQPEKSIKFAERVAKEAFKNGLYLYLRLNCLMIAPPLIIKESDLINGIGILGKAIYRSSRLT